MQQLHRVVIPKTAEERSKARYSFAYFIAPDSQTVIRPLTSSLIPEVKGVRVNYGEEMLNPKTEQSCENSPIITAYEHIMERVKTAYGVTNSQKNLQL